MKKIFWSAFTTLIVALPLYAQSTGSGSIGSDATGTAMGTGTSTMGPNSTTQDVDNVPRGTDSGLRSGSSTIDDRQMQEDATDTMSTRPSGSEYMDSDDLDNGEEE